MLRSISACSLLLLAGCASTRTETLLDQMPFESLLHPAIAAPPATDPGRSAGAEDAYGRLAPAAAQEKDGLRKNRFTIKGGYYGSQEDALDDGYIIDGAWTRFLNKWFAVEGEIGYLDASGDDSGTNTDVWSIPLMVNARVNVPVWILDIYGGVGIGTLYYELDSTTGFVSASADGWLLAGNAFVGTSVNLADKIALGLEGKYYVTDDISSTDEGLDAFAVMLTLGFGF